jgi:hypothetical protein
MRANGVPNGGRAVEREEGRERAAAGRAARRSGQRSEGYTLKCAAHAEGNATGPRKIHRAPGRAARACARLARTARFGRTGIAIDLSLDLAKAAAAPVRFTVQCAGRRTPLRAPHSPRSAVHGLHLHLKVDCRLPTANCQMRKAGGRSALGIWHSALTTAAWAPRPASGRSRDILQAGSGPTRPFHPRRRAGPARARTSPRSGYR